MFLNSVRVLSVLCLLALLLGSSVAAAVSPPQPNAADRCAVCGMAVAPYPNWVASIVFKDGSRAFFDGPKDMFTYFSDPGRYRPKAKREQIEDMFVTEYYTTRKVSVRDVYFISGSDVMGPMGSEMVPVAGRENAETFFRDHKGGKLMRFNLEKFSEIPLSK